MKIMEGQDSTITMSTGKDGETIIVITPKKEVSKKKWEPKRGSNYMQSNFDIVRLSSDGRETILAGMTGSKQELEARAKILRRTARLHALASELGGAKEFETNKTNFSIRFDEGKAMYECNQFYHATEKVYMTEECAKKICDMINNKEVEL